MLNKQLLSICATKMATDEQFAIKVAALQTKENVVELAAILGYELTLEDAEVGLDYIRKLADKVESLGDDDLDDIVGGCDGAIAACADMC